jgi:endonuclease/exonuclease/phosphatase family metal-dependent hydrolase
MRPAALVAIIVFALCSGSARAAQPHSLRVMTFNIWVGGEGDGKQGPIDQQLRRLADVIRAAEADIVGLQETRGREVKGARPDAAKQLAALLGWNYHDQGAAPGTGSYAGILTRLDITGPLPAQRGAIIRLPSGRPAHVYNVHFPHAPYEPYGLLGIAYEKTVKLSSEQEAIASARKSRGQLASAVAAAARQSVEAGAAVFVVGDFNEPSCQDWTDSAARSGKCPLKVDWPATRAMLDTGLTDAYRKANPDEVARPGLTWTPTTRQTDPGDRHDRIDFIFAGGKGLSVAGAKVVGEDKAAADIVVHPFPSDHRAVVATVQVE